MPTHELVFLLDVDNTLLDDDKVQGEFMQHFANELGIENRDHYKNILDDLWRELGYCDYLGALQRYRLSAVENMNHPHLLQMADFLLDYPFADALYPQALETVALLNGLGRTVILTDGDAVFQPRKVQRSGLWQAVDGHVLIYVHKEEMLADVVEHYPAHHYVMVDDKLRILSAMKTQWSERLTTVFPRQGHFALDVHTINAYAPADITIEHIGDLLEQDFSACFNAPYSNSASSTPASSNLASSNSVCINSD